MKYIKYISMAFFFFFIEIYMVEAKESVKAYLFWQEGCPHCAAEKEFLNELQSSYSELEVTLYEVSQNSENSELMDLVKKATDKESLYVPFTVIGEYAFTGYNSSFNKKITEEVKRCSKTSCKDVVKSILNNEEIEVPDVSPSTTMNLPFLGDVDIKSVSLPIVATVLGLVDGFNPCAMWVLIFLIGMLIGTKNRKRMLGLGTLFLATSALVYALFMVAWLKIMLSMTQITIIKILIAIVALIGAGWNLYSFYKSIRTKDVGCEVVNTNKRMKIMQKIRTFTSEKSLILASVGVITLAISVNFVELACSAGWPLVFTEILAMNHLSSFMYGLHIFIYILFYLFDDLIIFFIAVITFKITGISNKYTKYSHLIGGILMLLIGLLMLLKPEWLMLNF